MYADDLLKAPLGFSPDGASLVYRVFGDPTTKADIWILPDPLGMPGASKPSPFMRTGFNEEYPQFSPDGRWIAYESDESGRFEVYVAPFPGPGAKRQVSTSGGTRSRWRMDGKELFYRAAVRTECQCRLRGQLRCVRRRPAVSDAGSGGGRHRPAADRGPELDGGDHARKVTESQGTIRLTMGRACHERTYGSPEANRR